MENKKYYSEAHKKAQYKYNAKNLKRIPLDVQKAEYEIIAEAAASAGLPVNTFIKQAIREKIDRNK